MRQESYSRSTFVHDVNKTAHNSGMSVPTIDNWNNLQLTIDIALCRTEKNAIDTLLYIGKEIADHRKYHFTNFDNDDRIRQINIDNFTQRVEFVKKGIVINFILGQKQGIYRNDISPELVGRVYAKRMMDLHDTKIFSPQDLTYQTIYKTMFENFLQSICSDKGLKYFKNIRERKVKK